MHLVHHGSSWNSLPLLMVLDLHRKIGQLWLNFIIPEPMSPIGKDSNFIAILRAYLWTDYIASTGFIYVVAIQQYTTLVLLHPTLWKLTSPLMFNLWSMSQTNFVSSCFNLFDFSDALGFRLWLFEFMYQPELNLVECFGTNLTGTMEISYTNPTHDLVSVVIS